MIRRYGYIRCIYDNLGDIALDIGLRNLLREFSVNHSKIVLVPYSSSSKKMTLYKIMRGHLPFDSWILGGGTLILSHSAWFYDILSLYIEGCHPFCCLGAGVMPPDFFNQPSWVIDFWVNEVLSKMRFIGVRGKRSQQILRNYGIESTVIGDPALWIPKDLIGEYNPIPSTVGVNWGESGYSYGDNETSRRYFKDVVRMLSHQYKRIWFFAVCQKDVNFFHSLEEQFRKKLKLIVAIKPKDFARYIGKCNLFIGMKLHSVLLSLMAGVPTIMISYQPKCDEIMDELGLAKFSLRLDKFEVGSLYERVDLMSRLDIPSKVYGYKTNMEQVVRSVISHLVNQ